LGERIVIVLDTHALIWWVSEPAKVPSKARRVLDAAVKAGQPISVSAISVWEIAMLVSRNRLTLTIDVAVWVAKVEALPFLSFVPVDNRIAARAVHLEDLASRDPADRMIAATALGLGATLVTADAHLRAYRALKTLWD
jgi:PIN domain nuclease of toxin-antitoxin system